MKLRVEIPKDLSAVELRQYQRFLQDVNGVKDNKVIEQKMAQYFCNINYDDLFKIKLDDVNKINERINQLLNQKDFTLQKRFTLAGVEFGFIPNLEEITLGEYIDLDNYLGNWQEMHKAMAVLYRPITKKKRAWWSFGKNKEEQYLIDSYKGAVTYAEVMKYAPLDVVLGANFFFINLSKKLLSNTQDYLEKEMKKVQSLAAKHNLEKNGDGIVQSTPSQKEI